MLKGLVGSNSVEKILLYLLVNEQCYAHQLHRRLGLALTPVQKALERLEKGGVISCEMDKNRKIYRFNSYSPIIHEIEQLLKKTYQQLSAQERKLYHHPKQSKAKPRNEEGRLMVKVWDQLKSVKQMTLLATSRSHTSNLWSRKGSGKVDSILDGNVLTFREQGEWTADDGLHMSYRNTYRWTWHWREEMLSLEHLRRGDRHPVFLFYLTEGEDNLLESLNPHLCGDDTYFGWMQYNPLFLQMHIRTLGPVKNEKVETIYT